MCSDDHQKNHKPVSAGMALGVSIFLWLLLPSGQAATTQTIIKYRGDSSSDQV